MLGRLLFWWPALSEVVGPALPALSEVDGSEVVGPALARFLNVDIAIGHAALAYAFAFTSLATHSPPHPLERAYA